MDFSSWRHQIDAAVINEYLAGLRCYSGRLLN